MQSVVVNVAKDGACTDTVGAIFGIDELAEAVHDHSAVLPLCLFLILLRLNSISKKPVRKRQTQIGLVTTNFLVNITSNISL